MPNAIVIMTSDKWTIFEVVSMTAHVRMFVVLAFLVICCRPTQASRPLYNIPIVTRGLVVYYSFDEFTTIVPDDSLNQFDGEVNGSVVSDFGLRGGAAVFLNDSQDPPHQTAAINVVEEARFGSVDGPDASLVPRSNGMSFSAWVNVAGVGNQSLFQTRNQIGVRTQQIELRSDGRLRFAIRGDVEGDTIVDVSTYFDGNESDGPSYPAEEWFHVGLTYDNNPASDSRGIVKLLDNGEPIYQGISAAADVPIGGWNGCDENCVIDEGDASWQFFDSGALVGATAQDAGNRLRGMLDDLYVFNVALDDAEMRSLFTDTWREGLPHRCDFWLLAWSRISFPTLKW